MIYAAMAEKSNIPVELKYLKDLISYRISKGLKGSKNLKKPAMPEYKLWNMKIKEFLIDNAKKAKNKAEEALSEEEVAIILLALAPHFQSDFLDKVIETPVGATGQFPELGCVRNEGQGFRGLLPTGETAVFLLGDDESDKKLEIQKLFWPDGNLGRMKILWLEESGKQEPAMSGKILLARDYIELFLFKQSIPPQFGMSFPAHKMDVKQSWKDVVLPDETNTKINEVISWLNYGNAIRNDKWDRGNHIKPGYRVLFYGPPGTGKTFTASLLGKDKKSGELKQEVYRVDLSMVVSKFIGETEKNLEMLFARAENKNWILFFDEADALFSKRTGVRDAHDKYANQEVAYLLQRIEDYNGLVILSSNLKTNIDEAFLRRFNDIIKFPPPDRDNRSEIWKRILPERFGILSIICCEYEMSGGSIVNSFHLGSLKLREYLDNEKVDLAKVDPESTKNKDVTLKFLQFIQDGVKREYAKEGKGLPSVDKAFFENKLDVLYKSKKSKKDKVSA